MTAHRLTWVRSTDRYPDATATDSFIALNGEEEVGVVTFMAAGIDAGSWMWSMLLTHPGPAFNGRTNGLTPTRKEGRGS